MAPPNSTAVRKRKKPAPAPSSSDLPFEITTWSIKKLKRASYNPRKIDPVAKEQLRTSVKKFGVVEPTVVNVNPERYGTVVGGHQRLTIYEEEGYTTVPVVEVNLSLADEKELNLRLNKNVGGWDTALLREFFGKDELKTVGFLDSELSFFDELQSTEVFDAEAQYEIVEKVDEGYDGVLVFAKSNMDALWLKEFMGVRKASSYKCKAVGETRVVSMEQFKKRLEEHTASAVASALDTERSRAARMRKNANR